MKVDKNGHVYKANIRQKGVIAIDTEQNRYKITAMEPGDEAWYCDEFLGTRYTVLMYVGEGWQQVSPWYKRQGWAVRAMKERAYKENVTKVYISDIERTHHS